MSHSQWDLAIDLSAYQGKVDIPWMVQQQPRLKLVACKMMEMWAEGMTYDDVVDDQFAANVQGTHDAKVPLIPYVYYNGGMRNLHKRPFEDDPQIQNMIRALKSKTYHALALDLEKGNYWSGLTPAIATEAVRDMMNMIKHARKQGLIQDVPVGIYTNKYFIEDVCSGYLYDDIATGFVEFVWEARWMSLAASKTLTWAQVYDNLPIDTFKPTMDNVKIWQYRGGGGPDPAFKLPMTAGGAPQATDLNLITVPTEQFYSWLKFTPGAPAPVPVPVPVPIPIPVPTPIPGTVDLTPVTQRLDTLIALLKDIYNR